MKSEITVFGGGAAGLSVAFVLRLLGYPVRIVTTLRADEDRQQNRSNYQAFSSVHGVASVLTHSVKSPSTTKWLGVSMRFFQEFHDHAEYGVGKHQHWEVFERRVQVPDYLEYLHNYEIFSRTPPVGCPVRTGVEEAWGWSFDCFFVNPESYFPHLYGLYTGEMGGQIEQAQISHEAWREHVAGDVVVNCMNAGSIEVFDDPSPPVFVRGVLVYVDAPMPRSRTTSGLVSYNYEPAPGLYQTKGSKRPNDVYFYPRTDCLVLGGTREEGLPLPNAGENDRWWVGETMDCEYRKVGDHEVPVPVIEYNTDLIRGLTGLDISECDMSSAYGIRFSRRDGVRVEGEEVDAKK